MADMKLKNCPWCGKKPHQYKQYTATCINDHCVMNEQEIHVNDWDTRATDSTMEALTFYLGCCMGFMIKCEVIESFMVSHPDVVEGINKYMYGAMENEQGRSD